MGELYPNWPDKNGFLFLPIESIRSMKEKWQDSKVTNAGKIFFFCDYLHVSWLYGFEVIDKDTYMIGIIPTNNHFFPITNSLAEFLKLYMEDSPRLYEYGNIAEY